MLRKFLLAAVVAALAPATSQAVLTVTFNQTGVLPLTFVDDAPIVLAPGSTFDATNDPPVTNPEKVLVPAIVTSVAPLTTTTTINFGSFQLNMSARRTEGAALSEIVDNTLQLQNVTGSTATLTLIVTENLFSQPAGSPLFFRSGLSVVNSTGTEVDLDGAPGGLGTGVAFLTSFTNATAPAASDSGDPATLLVPTLIPLNNSTLADNSGGATFNRVGPTFSLSNITTVVLAPGATIQFSASVQIVGVAVPAPAGLVLAATAVPFAGLIRRRLRKPATV